MRAHSVKATTNYPCSLCGKLFKKWTFLVGISAMTRAILWFVHPCVTWAGIAQSVQNLATDWTVRVSHPGGGSEISRTHPDRPWGPPSLLYNGYRIFPWSNAAEAWRWPPTLSSANVKERVELYLYSTSEPSWPVLGWNLSMCDRLINRPSNTTQCF